MVEFRIVQVITTVRSIAAGFYGMIVGNQQMDFSHQQRPDEEQQKEACDKKPVWRSIMHLCD